MSEAPRIQIVGRSSSHFTRVARVVAHELGVDHDLVPIHDMTLLDPAGYAGNPALKLPILRRGDAVVFGVGNICRTLAALADARRRLVWPEELDDALSQNAQELVWHGMAAQVQLVFGTIVGKLPADNLYFAKCRAGFEGALRWLDGHVDAVLAGLPPRDTSLFEVTLYCLVDHLSFRPTLPIDAYPRLRGFARTFATRPAAKDTAYRFDPPPA